MEEALDMSLDDLIKKNKRLRAEKASQRFTRRGRHNARGNSSGYRSTRLRCPPDRGHAIATSYPLTSMRLRMREGSASQEDTSGHDAGTKLYLSNLDDGVSHNDIKVLFSDVGELKHYAIHFDTNGMPQGTGEVVYAQNSDALSAIKRYDNLLLDGKPIKIELVGFHTSDTLPAAHGGLGFGRPFGSNSNGRRGLGQGRGVGRASGAKRGRHKKVSVEGLDADLEKYKQDG